MSKNTTTPNPNLLTSSKKFDSVPQSQKDEIERILRQISDKDFFELKATRPEGTNISYIIHTRKPYQGDPDTIKPKRVWRQTWDSARRNDQHVILSVLEGAGRNEAAEQLTSMVRSYVRPMMQSFTEHHRRNGISQSVQLAIQNDAPNDLMFYPLVVLAADLDFERKEVITAHARLASELWQTGLYVLGMDKKRVFQVLEVKDDSRGPKLRL